MMISRRTRRLIRDSIHEDIGHQDITTQLLIPKQLTGEAFIDAKANGIVCGGAIVKEVFRVIDPALRVQQKTSDGTSVSKGKKVFRVSGKITSILKGERVALNFLSHLSGIASLTHQYVTKIKGTRAGIYDTRKTTPLWRELEKYAVKTGGGKNHRFGLWDEVLVKDNHWVSLRGSRKGRRRLFKRRSAASSSGAGRSVRRSNLRDCFAALAMTKKKVEIEIASLKELTNLLCGNFIPGRILLDNFSVPALKRAVQAVRKTRKKIALEASGGVTLENVRQIAQTGVDRISIGTLTHSAPALDFSLTLSKVNPRGHS